MNFKKHETAQKLRGGYYTPISLARYISQWVLEKSPKAILEPSCGDGVFIEAISSIELSRTVSLTGFELLEEEAVKARARKTIVETEVHAKDFLNWAIDQMVAKKQPFDAVLGNPPFIRYQYLPEESQNRAKSIFDMLALPFTKHTNAWVPFILASVSLMKPGSRLGMIIPSEILHVAHAQSLRTFLGKSCSRLLIVDPEEIWFEGTLQGAVILLAEKKQKESDHGDGLGIVRVAGKGFLNEHPSELFDSTPRMNGKTVIAKWTQALLTEQERILVDRICSHKEVHRFKDIGKVDVGIVTGANDFFLVDDETVRRFDLQPYVHPMFGRSEHCPGIIYDGSQHDANAERGSPTNFVWLKEIEKKFSKKVIEYIRHGEQQALHERYKCRIRSPWYTVPSVYSTEVGMLKRSHDMPRLIHNRIGAYTTDTAYRITPINTKAENLIYCFMNSLTALSAELEGRHYGGGVLELVPSEIEKLIVPLPSKIVADLATLDMDVRSRSVSEILATQDRIVLGALGLSSSDRDILRNAWLRLKNRRHRKNSEEINLSR